MRVTTLATLAILPFDASAVYRWETKDGVRYMAGREVNRIGPEQELKSECRLRVTPEGEIETTLSSSIGDNDPTVSVTRSRIVAGTCFTKFVDTDGSLIGYNSDKFGVVDGADTCVSSGMMVVKIPGEKPVRIGTEGLMTRVSTKEAIPADTKKSPE